MTDGPRTTLRRVLFNGEEGRLRAGWRLAAVLPAQIAAWLVGSLVLGTFLFVAPSSGPVATIIFGLGALALYGALAVTVLAMARWLDRRPVTEWLAGPGWWPDLVAGLLIGVGMATAAVATGLASGTYSVSGTFVTAPTAMLLPAPGLDVVIGNTHVLVVVASLLLVHVGVGLSEELLVRGYLFTNLAEGLAGVGRVGPRTALGFTAMATSVLFGLLHFWNPNAGPISTLNITLAGLFFAGTYLATGTLAVPIGVHITWNFALVGIYGLPVSGLSSAGSLVAIEHVGDTVVTGGGFGPEAGLVFYPALAVGVLASAAWIQYSRGRLTVEDGVAIYGHSDGRAGER